MRHVCFFPNVAARRFDNAKLMRENVDVITSNSLNYDSTVQTDGITSYSGITA